MHGVAARLPTELEDLGDVTMHMQVVVFQHRDEEQQRSDGGLVPVGIRVGEIACLE